MITPWQYGEGRSEHAQQAALFMWAFRAQHCGFDIANDQKLWELSRGEVERLTTLKPIPELRWLHAIPNGGMRSAATAANLKAEGVKPGVYDIFWPVTCKVFAGLYIEMKKPGGIKATKKDPRSIEQLEFSEHLDRMGYAHICCDDWKMAAWRIKDHWELR